MMGFLVKITPQICTYILTVLLQGESSTGSKESAATSHDTKAILKHVSV